MALSNLVLLVISSLLFAISAEAYYKSTTTSPAPISHISASPAASPSPSPSPSPSLDDTAAAEDTQSFKVPSAVVPLDVQGQVSTVVPLDVQGQVSKMVEAKMIATMHKTQEFMSIFQTRLADPETTSSAEECLKTCAEVYESAIDDIKQSLEDISSRDYYKANVDISAVSTNVDTCEECYNEMVGEDPELIKFDEWVRGITGDCLGALEKFSS